MKEIDLSKSLYEITEVYPELIGILKEMGFLGVANPIVRNTLGRATTIPKGCEKQGKDLEEVIKKLEELYKRAEPPFDLPKKEGGSKEEKVIYMHAFLKKQEDGDK